MAGARGRASVQARDRSPEVTSPGGAGSNSFSLCLHVLAGAITIALDFSIACGDPEMPPAQLVQCHWCKEERVYFFRGTSILGA